MVELFPDRNIQEMREIIDTMEMRSKEILEGKREALRAGDEALKQQIGEGKDIMSILRKQLVGSDVPGLAWPESPGFGLACAGSGLP